MKLFLVVLSLLLSNLVYAVEAPAISDTTLSPVITVMVLYSGDGIPEGWLDSTTRPDATDLCNKLIATQSKEFSTPVSRSRCIIKVE